MNKLFIFTTIVSVIMVLNACGEGGDPLTLDQLTQQQNITKENAGVNANEWVATNKPNSKMMVRGDSTIGNKGCKVGDTYATVTVIPNDGTAKFDLQCSTYQYMEGGNCWTNEDFNSRPALKKIKNVCQDDNPNVVYPFPAPRLVQ